MVTGPKEYVAILILKKAELITNNQLM